MRFVCAYAKERNSTGKKLIYNKVLEAQAAHVVMVMRINKETNLTTDIF